MDKEELLYLYFSDGLKPSQKVLFDELLENDTVFKEQFDFEKNIKKVIDFEEDDKLKNKLNQFEQEISATKPEQNSGFNWRVAASIIILLGSGWFSYNTFFTTNYEELYNTNYQEYPNTEFAITRSDTLNSIERKAFVAYEAQDYENAVKFFEKLSNNSQKPYLNFYRAQAYLKAGSIDNAKILFSTIIKDNLKFVAESHWYLAMIALKEKDKKAAKKQLNLLVTNYTYNKAKAITLLKKLK